MGYPNPTGFSPSTASTAGGTVVTVTGTDFDFSIVTGGWWRPFEITVWDVGGGAVLGYATAVTYISPTQCSAVLPSLAAGTYNLRVYDVGYSGFGAQLNGLSYVDPPLVFTFTSITPARGSIAGGTSVEIVGTGFDAAQPYIDFGGTMIYDINLIDDTHLTCVTPAHAVGLVSVDLYSDNGFPLVMTPNAYEYFIPPAPTITQIDPIYGSTLGATAITVTGTDFVDGATIELGGVPCTSVVFVSSTSLTAMTPAGTGTVDVVVTNPDTLTNTLAGGFTFINLGTVSKEYLQLAPSGFKILVITANSSRITEIKGPYVWQSDAPFTLSADISTTTTGIIAGKSYKSLVLSSNDIPEGPGYLVFNYGQNNQEGPIKYLYKITENIVALDPSYTFQQFHSTGTSVVAVSKMGPHTPTGHGDEYPPYVTNPPDARKQLQDLISAVTSAGIFIDFIIRYPNQLYGTLSVYD